MIQILRSWEGGPLREFAEIRPTKSWGIPYDGKLLYANQYICDLCGNRVVGLYRVLEKAIKRSQIPESTQASDGFTKWACSSCRPRGKQPEHLKTYRESKKAETC